MFNSSSYHQLAKSYDSLTTDVPYVRFADFYQELFRINRIQPESILELACGTGSMTEQLCHRGYDVVAVDSSPDMLAIAMDKLCNITNRPLLLCQSMEELDLYGTVDAAVCTLDGMNYLDGEGLKEALRRILLFLNPGGILIFDINSELKLKSLDGQIFIDETDDCFCVWRTEYLQNENACLYGMDLFEKAGKGWKRSQEEHVEYIYSQSSMEILLKSIGFEEIHCYGELKTENPQPDENRLFFTALKPKDMENG